MKRETGNNGFETGDSLPFFGSELFFYIYCTIETFSVPKPGVFQACAKTWLPFPATTTPRDWKSVPSYLLASVRQSSSLV